MDNKVKIQIAKMLIPVIGTWWLLSEIIFGYPFSPYDDEITWWEISDNAFLVILGLVFYQMTCWIGWKVFYMMYFFNYSFEQVFTQW